MAPPMRLRVVAAAFPGRMLTWLLGALAAAHIEAVRLQGLSSGGGNPGGASGAAVLPSGNAGGSDEMETEETQEHVAVRLAAAYVDAVNIDEPMCLSQVRDILYRLEDFNESLSLVAESASDPPEGFDRLVSDLNAKAEALIRVAEQKKWAGEEDDGGDVPPSQRDNICNTIHMFLVDEELREKVQELCESLDSIRTSLLEDMDAEPGIFEVAWRLKTLAMLDEFAFPHIAEGVAIVLGQERRWIISKFAGDSEGRERIFELLSTWEPDDDEDLDESDLQDMYDVAQGISLEGDVSLTALRTSLYRLETLEGDVEEFLNKCTDPDLCTQGEDLVVLIRDKFDTLSALAEQKAAAGEVDEIDDFAPSQRNNICRNVDEYNLEVQLLLDVMLVCESLDQWRRARLLGEGEDAAFLEVSRHLSALKGKEGHADSKVVRELEVVLMEEWRWRSRVSDSDSDSDDDSDSESHSDEE